MSKGYWEHVQGHERGSEQTYRMKVPGGWVYRFERFRSGSGRRDAVVFVPDPSGRCDE